MVVREIEPDAAEKLPELEPSKAGVSPAVHKPRVSLPVGIKVAVETWEVQRYADAPGDMVYEPVPLGIDFDVSTAMGVLAKGAFAFSK